MTGARENVVNPLCRSSSGQLSVGAAERFQAHKLITELLMFPEMFVDVRKVKEFVAQVEAGHGIECLVGGAGRHFPHAVTGRKAWISSLDFLVV